MKLLLDALQLDNQSGTGTYVRNLIQGLAESVEVEWKAAVTRPNVDLKGWELHAIPRRPRLRSGYRRHFAFEAIVRAARPDVVHFPANFATVIPIRSSSGPAIVTTLHDLTFCRNPHWFPYHRAVMYRELARRAAKYSDILLTDSESSAEDLRHYLNVPPQRIVVVPLGCTVAKADSEHIRIVKERYGLPESFFLFVGTIEPRKNLPRLISAWDSIASECPWELVIAGREGWKTRDYRRAIAEARHRDRIRSIGFVPDEDISAVMAAASVFVWPSLYEGFGLPPLDAMAAGMPVLTSNTSSLPEVVLDSALTVNPEDTDAIAEGMLRLSTDAELRERLSTAGLARARETNWRKTLDGVVAAYRRAIECRS